MKKLLVIALVLIGLLVLAGCAKKADATAKAFFKAVEYQDFAGAKKLSTEKTQGMLTFVEEMYKGMPDNQKSDYKKIKYTVTKVEEDGDKATISYDQWKVGEPESKKNMTAGMIKEDGKWRVDLQMDRFF